MARALTVHDKVWAKEQFKKKIIKRKEFVESVDKCIETKF